MKILILIAMLWGTWSYAGCNDSAREENRVSRNMVERAYQQRRINFTEYEILMEQFRIHSKIIDADCAYLSRQYNKQSRICNELEREIRDLRTYVDRCRLQVSKRERISRQIRDFLGTNFRIACSN